MWFHSDSSKSDSRFLSVMSYALTINQLWECPSWSRDLVLTMWSIYLSRELETSGCGVKRYGSVPGW